MIVPTLALAIFITVRNKADQAELVHNLAICFWIAANSTWMIGEFYFHDKTRPIAVVFFILGLLMMTRYYFTAAYKMTQSDKKGR